MFVYSNFNNYKKRIPLTDGERNELVELFLSSYENPPTQELMKNIVDLTDGYTIPQLTGFFIDIASSSKDNIFERSNCIEKLAKTINKIDTDRIKQLKLMQLKKMVYKPFKPFFLNFHSLQKENVDLSDDVHSIFPTAEERLNIIKNTLLEHKKIASEFLTHKIVAETSGFELSNFENLINDIVKTSESHSLDIERYIKYPTKDERYETVKDILSLTKKSADEPLVWDIAELTELYDMPTIKKIVVAMIEQSKADSLDRASCIEQLEKAIDLFDKNEEIKKFKLTQLEAIISKEPLPVVKDEQKIISKQQIKKYPLLNDIYHSNKILFEDAAAQLKTGKFHKNFHRGMLLYGPPGVGKTEIVEAMANESNCKFFTISASEIVNGYKGSGSASIQEIFSKAKAVNSDKGVIVFIDELERLSPRTTDEKVQFSSPYEGQEEGNSLTQIWIEHDNCLKRHNNILIVAETNKFELADKRIRDRFWCIEFSCPNEEDAYKILKNKAQQHSVSLTESDFKSLAKKMKGLSGRELTNFMCKMGYYINKQGVNSSDAYKKVTEELEANKKSVESQTPNRRIELAKDQLQAAAIQGVVQGGVQGGASEAASFGAKKALKYFFGG
ncbi:MAG: ATP-binding protein [Candidatus Babeliales bacterium]